MRGLESGVDDYVTKPLSPRELIARIKAVLRRGPLITADNFIHVGKLKLDTQNHKVLINQKNTESDEIISLTLLEYKLLYFLLSHKNKICSRDKLLDHVWGRTANVDARTVDVQIRRLRDKLKPHECQDYIQTKRGLGYVFHS